MNLKAALGMCGAESTRTTTSFDEGSVEPQTFKRIKRDEAEAIEETPTLTKADSTTGSERDSTAAETVDTRNSHELKKYRF